MSKKTIIKGTLILTITGIATKLLGFYNRIFLTRLIGVKELGVYQLIFPVYVLAISFCCQGIATSLTKQVSYYTGKKEKANSKSVFKLALLLSFSLSILAFFTMNLFSDYISTYLLKNRDCSPLLKIISLSIPFVAVKTCINSYLVGMDKPEYHGLSHFTEQIIRIGTAYLLSILWVGNIIGAKLAVVAVISGEIFASILSIILYFRYNKKYDTKSKKIQASNIQIRRKFLSDALPITSTGLMLTMFSSLEAIILPSMLFKFYNNNDMALEMYGIVTGIVIPFLLLPSTVTTSLSTMLLPAVSYAHAQKNSKTITKTISYSVMFCFTLGVATCIVYTFFGKWACIFAFKSETAGELLTKMCIICPFIYMAGNMSAILNGLDKAFLNLMFNIINICIRIGFTVTLVPKYGIYAYVIGMMASYITLNILMIIAIKHNKPENQGENS